MAGSKYPSFSTLCLQNSTWTADILFSYPSRIDIPVNRTLVVTNMGLQMVTKNLRFRGFSCELPASVALKTHTLHRAEASARWGWQLQHFQFSCTKLCSPSSPFLSIPATCCNSPQLAGWLIRGPILDCWSLRRLAGMYNWSWSGLLRSVYITWQWHRQYGRLDSRRKTLAGAHTNSHESNSFQLISAK